MLRIIGISVLVVLVLGVLAFVQLFPVIPTSLGGWLAFFFVGIPFYVLAEASGEAFWSGARFEGWRPAARIAAGVVILLVVCAVLYWPWKFVIELIQS
jgi:hypothetical protein